MSSLKKINLPEILRQLTYLQLCIVPSFIEPYLSRLTLDEIKCTFFLYMQTFFEINGDLFRSSGTVDLQSIVRESCRRPIGKQMVHLLKTTLTYYIKNDYPLHTFFLEFDQNTENFMIHLQKALLKEISSEGKYSEIINILMIALNLALDLFEIKRGNGKYLLNLNRKNQNYLQQLQTLQIRKNIHEQFIKEVSQLQKSVHITKNLRDLYDYYLNLAQCYQFVVLQQSYKQAKPQTQTDLLTKQKVQIQLQLQGFQSGLSDYRFWFIANESDTFEMISMNYLSLLKNFSETYLKDIQRLKNSIVILILKISQSQNDCQIQFRVDSYTLLLAVKLLYTIKYEKSNQTEQNSQLQDSFKQIMQLQIASIRSTFYFLAAFLQLDVLKQVLYARIVNLIAWVMSQYRKYTFKSQQLIYADFIASSLDLLVSWKQSQKQEEDEKQIQTVLNRLTSKSKAHGQHSFSLFFQTLNPKLFEYVTTCLMKVHFRPVIILKVSQNPDQLETLLLMFQDKINKFFFPTHPQPKQKSKQLEFSESTLSYIYQIYLNHSQKSITADIVFMRLYNLLRSLIVCGKNELLRKQLIEFQTLKCLEQFTKLIVKSINNLQVDYSISQIKKNQGSISNTAQNPENQNALLSIQKSIRPSIFLNMLLFAFNPNSYKICFLHALILDSYFIDESLSQIILNFYNHIKGSNKFVWQENQTQLLKFSRRYDSLEIFYENILLQSTEIEKKKVSKIAAFKRFSQQWCSEQANYQWLSDQKASRIRLYSLKNFCLKIQSDMELIK